MIPVSTAENIFGKNLFFVSTFLDKYNTMSEAGGTSRFVRKYTLASGGPFCDCGYKKIAKN